MLRSIVVVFCLLVPATAFAQMTPQEAAKKGLDAYKDGEFADALRLLNLASDDITAFSANQQAAIYKYIAFCHIAEDRRSEAKFAFKRAIFYKPDFDLDEERLSPRIIEVFKQAKLELANDTGGGGTGAPVLAAEYDVTGALWRSASAPGWGQLHTERKAMGYATAGLNAAALGYAAYWTVASARAEFKADQVRDDGTTETQPEFLTQARDYRVRRNQALGIAAGIYALTLVDSVLVPSMRRSKAEREGTSIYVRGAATPRSGYVQLTVEF